MPKQITHKLSLNQAQLLRADMATNTNPYFVFLARHLPYQTANGSVTDTVPSEVDVSVDGITYDIYRNMLSAKHIKATDVAPMIKYTEWQSGVVYTQYDHTDATLSTQPWYVVVKRGTNRDVFICLGNNNGAPSTVAPNFNDTTPAEPGGYETQPDRYWWKYMYTISQTDYNKFSMADYIPVIPNANVTANSVSGSIDFVTVTYAGSQYDSYNSGSIRESVVGGNPLLYTISQTAAANANFYKDCSITITEGQGAGQIRTIAGYTAVGDTKRVLIDSAFDVIPNASSLYEITPRIVVTGDGDGFRGRALVNAASSNSIYKIEVLNGGANYTWASASITGNTGGTTNFATAKPIISPFGGHGYNVADELRATALGVSVKFDSTESADKVVDVNEFRTIGIIKKPLFANVTLTVASSADFNVGDSVVQQVTGATGTVVSIPTITTVRVTDVVGYFASGRTLYVAGNTAANSNVSAIAGQSTYADQTVKLALTTASGSFTLDEQVTQGTANAYVYSANSTTLRLTNVYGNFGTADTLAPGAPTTLVGGTSQSTANVAGVLQGDFVKGSGEVLYIDNKTPVAKATDQTETIKIILEF